MNSFWIIEPTNLENQSIASLEKVLTNYNILERY